ncbi:MAG TPA: hypothetical protein VI456_06870, partial [Polyangia bacterium]
MNRLRDEVGQGAIHEKGIEMIRRTPGTPADGDLRRRVWTVVRDGEPRGSRALRWSGLRSLAVAGVILCICGSAAAMIGHYGLHSVWPRATAPSPAPSTPLAAKAVAAPRVLARASSPAAAPAFVPAPAATVAKPRPLRAVAQHAVDLTPAAATAERTQVLDAMVALRHDHDAARAGRMLDHYLATHPHGALREEALVLAIAAAAARGDGPTARRLAAGYAGAYPNGRFREF